MKKTSKITTAVLLVLALVWSVLPAWASAYDAYESTVTLTFGNSAVTETNAGEGYAISGTTLSISASGVYTVTGSCSNGSITVKKNTKDVVLILSDLTLSSSSTAPIVCGKSTGVTLYVKGDVTLTDAEDPADDGESDSFEGAAIKTKSGSSLKIEGDGTLNVDGSSCKNGIKGASEATVTVDMTGTLNVIAANNGIASDGAVVINGGAVNVTAGNEGIKSEPDENDGLSDGTVTVNGGTLTVNTVDLKGGDGIQATYGVFISGGVFDIDAYGDGIQSGANVVITNGVFDIKTLNGYNGSGFDADTMSCKGIKASSGDEDTENAENTVDISGGTFKLNTIDDAIHSDGYIVITGGTFDIYTGDDGMHADTSLTLGTENSLERDPFVTVNYSYEGLEAGNVYIYGGKYYVYSTDDGINAAGGSSNGSDPGNGGGNHFNPGGGPGRPGDHGGWGVPTTGGDYSVNIYGGDVYVNAQGDGLDSNGTINLEGGNIEVWAQSSGDNEPLDSDGELYVKGATVFAAGCTGMGMASPKSGSQTYKNYSIRISSGSVVTVKNGSDVVYEANAPKSASYVFFSSPDMSSSYTVSAGSGAADCSHGNAFLHTFGSGVVTTEPGDDTDGVVTYTCTVCGATERQTVTASTVIDTGDDNGDDDGDDGTVFTATFVHDENATINVYYKQSYGEPDETNVDTATARNSESGESDGSGSGQVNFVVILADGYEIDEIKIEGGYNKLKNISEDENISNLYRITKITSDITVTVTVKKTEQENDGEVYGDINGDGMTDNKDVVMLFRYLSGSSVEGVIIDRIDVNGDGEPNNKDVTVLFRYVSSM